MFSEVDIVLSVNSAWMVHSHIRWDGMGWAALVTHCVNASTEIHKSYQHSLSHNIPAQRVCVNAP